MLPSTTLAHRASSGAAGRSWLLPGTLGLLTLAMRLGAGPWPLDDAYITFRYARNLANGLGLVYNPGQLVLGTSSPLFTLLLASVNAVTGADLPWAAFALNAVADAITAFVLYRLGRRLGFPVWSAVMCTLTWAFYPLAARYAAGGMETALVTVLILGGFGLYVSGHRAWALVVLGFAVLTRADAIAAVFAVLVAETLRTRRILWRLGFIPVAIVLPWLIGATVWYGNPLPQSLRAKSHAVYLTAPWENALQILYNVGGLLLVGPRGLAAQGLSVYLPSGSQGLPIATAILLLSIWLVGTVRPVRADRRWAAVFALPLLYGGTYAVVGVRGSLLAEWYLVPLAPLFFLGIFAGLASMCERIPARLATPVAVALSATFVAAQLVGLNAGRIPGKSALVPRVVWTEREDLYRRAAKFLRPRLRPGDVVAAPEIGALGYYCGCRILDTVGLVSPEAVKYYPLPGHMYTVNYAVPPDLIRDEKPTYLVSLDVFTRRSVQPALWFSREYQVVEQVATRAFGSNSLVIFRRVVDGARS